MMWAVVQLTGQFNDMTIIGVGSCSGADGLKAAW